MKILLVGDFHLSDQNPISRIDNYREAGLRKLDAVIDIANGLTAQNKLDAVIFLGDIFHRKRPANISHYLVNCINRGLDQFYAPTFLLPGNHDIPTDGRAIEHYPISNLRFSEILTQPKDFMGWRLLPYGGTPDMSTDAIVSYIRTHRATERNIILVHGDLHISEAYYLWGGANIVDICAEPVDYVLFGHIHKPYGPRRMGSGAYVHNPGAMMRISNSANDRELLPHITWLDTDTASFRLYQVKHAPAIDVFRESEPVAKEQVNSEFVDSVMAIVLAETGIPAIMQKLDECIDVSFNIRERAKVLLSACID